MEPPNNGHIGDECFVHCSEVVPSSEVEICRQGVNSVSIVGRLSIIGGSNYLLSPAFLPTLLLLYIVKASVTKDSLSAGHRK